MVWRSNGTSRFDSHAFYRFALVHGGSTLERSPRSRRRSSGAKGDPASIPALPAAALAVAREIRPDQRRIGTQSAVQAGLRGGRRGRGPVQHGARRPPRRCSRRRGSRPLVPSTIRL
jgi:hypothetical protein